ncbi:uncharacterized [Tachysurus ichikawai]
MMPQQSSLQVLEKRRAAARGPELLQEGNHGIRGEKKNIYSSLGFHVHLGSWEELDVRDDREPRVDNDDDLIRRLSVVSGVCPNFSTLQMATNKFSYYSRNKEEHLFISNTTIITTTTIIIITTTTTTTIIIIIIIILVLPLNQTQRAM